MATQETRNIVAPGRRIPDALDRALDGITVAVSEDGQAHLTLPDGTSICDVEAGDTLAVLVSTALGALHGEQ